MKYSVMTLCILASLWTSAQTADRKRELFLGLSPGVMGAQDTRFSKARFSGIGAGIEIGSRLIKPQSIRGWSADINSALANSKQVSEGIILIHFSGIKYEYVHAIKEGWYAGGQMDIIDFYLRTFHNLGNANTLDINNTLSAKLLYRKALTGEWIFQSSFGIGLLAWHRSSTSNTFNAPIKSIEKGTVNILNEQSDLATGKNFYFATLGRFNKVNWRTEMTRKRFVLSYTWSLLHYREWGTPVSYFAHNIGIRYNIINKSR